MYATTTVQLIEKNGELYTPKVAVVDALLKEFYSNDPIIICRHDAGDVDTIKFPAYNADNLRSALFDDREMGIIPFVKSVLMPDGKEFVIDAPTTPTQTMSECDVLRDVLKRMTLHFLEARNYTRTDEKLAMIDGGIADELLKEASHILTC